MAKVEINKQMIESSPQFPKEGIPHTFYGDKVRQSLQEFVIYLDNLKRAGINTDSLLLYSSLILSIPTPPVFESA